ncbi:hypothetical protein [Persicitalea jodogahamensis]|uniref:Uncharacterized protein n=1 Tax=Persicitalea jodogahamensis TaxID=402147 RepID=A0A8J3G9J4_9BACT|nr:hypothetical protein [Persicitalea jodogahamensis]GHB63960.1 hypothetical protein GCM10007390_17280 [Persicitalea jodogahamensis]
MIHEIEVAAHPDFPDCTHKVAVLGINILLDGQEVQLRTVSTIYRPDGSVHRRTEPKYVLLRATDESFVNAQGELVEGPADGTAVFPQFQAIFSQAWPLLLPFVEQGVANAMTQERYL